MYVPAIRQTRSLPMLPSDSDEKFSTTRLSSFQAHYVAAGCDASATATLVASEAAALLIAGSDTTSMTLVYLTYLLALNPRIQTRLQAELDAALPDREHLPFVNELDRLEYLGAIIKEILRLHPAVPGRFIYLKKKEPGSFDS